MAKSLKNGHTVKRNGAAGNRYSAPSWQAVVGTTEYGESITHQRLRSIMAKRKVGQQLKRISGESKSLENIEGERLAYEKFKQFPGLTIDNEETMKLAYQRCKSLLAASNENFKLLTEISGRPRPAPTVIIEKDGTVNLTGYACEGKTILLKDDGKIDIDELLGMFYPGFELSEEARRFYYPAEFEN